MLAHALAARIYVLGLEGIREVSCEQIRLGGSFVQLQRRRTSMRHRHQRLLPSTGYDSARDRRRTAASSSSTAVLSSSRRSNGGALEAQQAADDLEGVLVRCLQCHPGPDV